MHIPFCFTPENKYNWHDCFFNIDIDTDIVMSSSKFFCMTQACMIIVLLLAFHFHLQVVALTLMTASGEIIHCSRQANKEIFLAALCHLGAVGIILSVTWQCEPAFRLHQQTESMTLEQVCRELNYF